MVNKDGVVTYYDGVDLPPVKVSPAGTDVIDVFGWIYDADRKCYMHVKTGEMNFNDFIQASRSSCDINQIVARAAVDSSVLNKAETSFFDATELPTDLRGMSQLHDSLETQFAQFPDAFKAQFVNGFIDFEAAFLGGDISTYVQKYNDSLNNGGNNDE